LNRKKNALRKISKPIETYLCSAGGYIKGNPTAFDRKAGLDAATLISFVKAMEKTAKAHLLNAFAKRCVRLAY
jgi:hypothetical protein